MRRLLILASAIVFLDVTFYAAITPLLPDYARDLDLSKAQAGILSASYAAGTLLASLPAGFLAARIGPRRTVIGGLLLLGLSSFVFGFADQIALLDGARFVQGVSGALTWSGAFTWLVLSSPVERRGSVIGTAIGNAVAGALLGPPLGALAGEVGTEPVFGSVLVLTSLLAVIAGRTDDPHRRETQRPGAVFATLRSRVVLLAAALVAAPSLLFGAESVIVPLRIDDLGGGRVLIAAGFTIGAALEAVLAPLAGRHSDRSGRSSPYIVGALICAASIVVIGVATVLGIVVAAVVCSAIGAGLCFTPATAMLSDAAEATGLHQGFAGGLMNMAWAGGQVTGGVAGGGAADVLGYAAPCIAVAALLVAMAIVVHRGAPSRAPQPVPAGPI